MDIMIVIVATGNYQEQVVPQEFINMRVIVKTKQPSPKDRYHTEYPCTCNFTELHN